MCITPQSCIGAGCLAPHPAGFFFHGRAGAHATFYGLCACVPEPCGIAGSVTAGPYLGTSISIGGHAAVLGAIRVGDDVKIAPNVRICSDVPPGVMVISRNMRIASMRPINGP